MEELTLEEVIRRYGSMVYRLAYACMHHPSDADDVFQDVFLRYAQKAPPFHDEEHRKAWLLRVTINRCRSHFRSPWHRRTAPLEAAGGVAFDQPQEQSLDWALCQLPPKYRTAIHLHYYENFSTQEIAALTRQYPSTVRAQLTRGRRMLEAILRKGEDDG